MKKERTAKQWLNIFLSKYFFSKVYFDLNNDPAKSVLLASVHRSGSTILMETINYKNEYRIIFEPFHQDKIKEVINFASPYYIDSKCRNESTLSIFKNILSGRLRHSWSDAHNLKFIAHKRLIKCVRSNLMLEYIQQNFPNTPIVL